MTLTLLVVVVSLSAVANMAMALANKDMYLAVRAEAKVHKPQSLHIVIMNLAFSIIIGCLWVVLALVEGDWRYAAIYLIPFTTSLMTRAALR